MLEEFQLKQGLKGAEAVSHVIEILREVRVQEVQEGDGGYPGTVNRFGDRIVIADLGHDGEPEITVIAVDEAERWYRELCRRWDDPECADDDFYDLFLETDMTELEPDE